MKTTFHHTLLLTILIVAGVLATACQPEATSDSTLIYGLTLAPSGLDPHLNASFEMGIPLSSVYDTLVFRDPETGQFVPGLAERWDISPDGRTYRFYLRDDVRFHDGTPFNAEAVAANLAYITNPSNRSQKAVYMLGPYSGCTILDTYTIEIHLEQPFAPLLDSLSQVFLGMASPRALEEWGPEAYQFHQVGTGPYRFVDYVPNDHITLERNPDYAWAPSIYSADTPQVDTIIFRFFSDAATRAYAIESGQVDIMGEIPPVDALRLAQLPTYSLQQIEIPGIPLQFIFNTTLFPTDQQAVRTALVEALDRHTLVETVFMNTSPTAEGALSASLLPREETAPYAPYNPEAAQAALLAAGWERSPETGRFFVDGNPVTLFLVVPPWGYAPDVAQLMAASWEALGIDVEIVLVPGFGGLLETQASGEYHLIALNDFGSDPHVLTSYYHSDGAYNWSGYQSAELDALLTSAVSLPQSEEERLALYRQITFLVQEETLIIPIRDYVNLVVHSSRVDNLHFSAQGWFPFLIDVRLLP